MNIDFEGRNGWRTPNSYSDTFKALPRSSGVYAIVKPHIQVSGDTIAEKYDVLYIGMSINLKQRFARHEIKQMFDERQEYVQVWFQSVPVSRLRTRERNLIRRYNPPYNLQHRMRGI